MTEEKIREALKQAMELCKEERIEGINLNINGYYVQFYFSKLKNKCDKCGQVIE